MTIVLPKKKQRILSFLKGYIGRHGYAPTLTEIAKETGVSSLATVHEHLAFLEENGFIRRGKNQAREIEVVEEDRGTEYIEGTAVQLPVIGLITAGAPIEAIEDRSEMVAVPAAMAGRADKMYVLKVRGDSMIESMIADGDYVVVQKSETANNGEIVVALLEDGTATLKKFFREKGYFRLQPANEKYQPIKVKELFIQGIVRGVIRQMA